MNPTVKILLAGTAILALPLSAQTTIFSDDFSSGSVPSNGWDNQFGSEVDSDPPPPPSTSVVSGELVHDSTNHNGSTFVRDGTAKNFSPVSLDNTGDYLELEFDAKAVNYDDDGFGFRVSFTDFTSTNDGNFARGGSEASGFSYQMGITTGDTNNRVTNLSETAGDRVMGDGQSFQNLTTTSLETTFDTYLMRLERDASGGIEISMDKNTTSLGSTTFAAGDVFTYDFSNVAFGVRSDSTPDGAGDQFTLDNVTMTAVPEPSSFAFLAGLLSIGALVIRRRR